MMYNEAVAAMVKDALRLRQEVPDGVFLEAEKPKAWDGEAEREVCRKRLAFYHRLGADPVEGVGYYQPLPDSDLDQPMYLLFHPIGRTGFGRKRLLSRIKAIYRRVYGIRKVEDEAVWQKVVG